MDPSTDRAAGESPPELSVIIPAWNEAENLRRLLPALHDALRPLGVGYEIVVADTPAGDPTCEICAAAGARCLAVAGRGYGTALRAGIAAARGKYLLTMDADLSHPADFVATLWAARERGELVIASRYVPGGDAEMPGSRRLLSRILNAVFRAALDVRVRDLSSGFRLYHRRLIDELRPEGRDFNILPEILVLAVTRGFTVVEVPFRYARRGAGSSHARLVAFGIQYLRTLRALRRRREALKRSAATGQRA